MTKQELIDRINGLEEQMKACGYGSEVLQELIELKQKLDEIENEE